MPLCRNLLLAAAATIGCLAPQSIAQTASTSAPATSPSFDVVSIRPTRPGSGSVSGFNNDTYTATNATLKSIIQYDAYDIAGAQILDIPPALSSVAFDIQAKIDPAVYTKMKTLSHEQLKLEFTQMVQQLLADRFKLIVHSETRQLPVYDLVVAKNGPKLQPAENPAAGTSLQSGRGWLTAKGVSSAQLVQKFTRMLSDELGRVVIDKTGLTGRYDLILKWTPALDPAPLLNGAPDTSAPPSIFTAVQEQLGLKLESAKGPVQVLVVDHAELPSEN